MTIAMRIGALVAAAALALALVGIIALDTAGAAQFQEQVSGNFIDTSIDTDGDGMNASAWSGKATGNGSPNIDGILEVKFGPTGLCASGEIEGTVVAYSMVRRYANGDLLFSELVDGTVCLDPVTELGSATVNAELAGGTGRYDGATGTYTADYAVVGLVLIPDQGIAHGAFHGSTSG